MTLPSGSTRNPDGTLNTVASADTNARVADVRPPATLKPAVAGVLGLLTLLTAAPGAAVASLLATGAPVPGWLAAAAAICGGFSPLLGAGAYWAAGGDPLDLLKAFAPKVPKVTAEVSAERPGVKGPLP